MHGSDPSVIEIVTRRLAESGINVIKNKHVSAIDQSGVTMKDGTHVPCTVPIWATGADA